MQFVTKEKNNGSWGVIVLLSIVIISGGVNNSLCTIFFETPCIFFVRKLRPFEEKNCWYKQISYSKSLLLLKGHFQSCFMYRVQCSITRVPCENWRTGISIVGTHRLGEVLFKTLQFDGNLGIVVGFVGRIVTELCSIVTEVTELCSTWYWSWKSKNVLFQKCPQLLSGLKLNSDMQW